MKVSDFSVEVVKKPVKKQVNIAQIRDILKVSKKVPNNLLKDKIYKLIKELDGISE